MQAMMMAMMVILEMLADLAIMAIVVFDDNDGRVWYWKWSPADSQPTRPLIVNFEFPNYTFFNFPKVARYIMIIIVIFIKEKAEGALSYK